jgi:hypothetical protein
MRTARSLAVVGVFQDAAHAQQAILELQRIGIPDDQIGVAARHTLEPYTTEVRDLRHDLRPSETHVAQGAVTGIAAGAGLGALAGLAIVAGMLPPIGPAIAGGTLAVILSSAAAGAAAMGLAGALAGMGVDKEEAEFYESEFEAGRVVVAVTAPGREDEAHAIIKRFGGYDMADQVAAQQVFPPVSPGTLSAAETDTPVAMPMEPGVPANIHLSGEPIEPHHAAPLDVPVRAEDLVGEPKTAPPHSTVHVPASLPGTAKSQENQP